MSKRLGGIKGCKYETSSWHLNGCPDGNIIGSTVQCRGEALGALIAIQGHQKTVKIKQRQCSTPSNMVVINIITYYIGCKYKATTYKLMGGNTGEIQLGSERELYKKSTLIVLLFKEKSERA